MLLHDFSPRPRSLDEWGLGPYPLQETLDRVLARDTPPEWTASGLNRTLYLDLCERIVRMAAGWVDEKGAVLDPILGSEWGQTTPRFCAGAASLLAFGRVPELAGLTYRCLDYACASLHSEGIQKRSPDFWMRDLTWALACLEDIAPAGRMAAWKAELARVDPETHYSNVDPTHTRLGEFHNWAVFAASGEVARQHLKIGSRGQGPWGETFFDLYMAGQIHRFTEFGMYRDPNDPFTYDLTTRLQFTIALAFGYGGPYREKLEEIERRGAISALLYTSPEGFVPFGGRSSQFQFQEGLCAAMFEWEARRYRETAPRLAGAFKRQARLGVQSTQRWLLDADPLRHIKNDFAPETRHGCDTYGHYSVYSLVAATMYGIAAVFADDSIGESPTPAELGGYVLELKPAFHKVIANAAGHHIEIDPAAHLAQDASGLGRILLAGEPFGILPTMPCSPDPHYVIAREDFKARAAACGPQWQADGQWRALAEFGLEEVQWETSTLQQQSGFVEFLLSYRLPGEIEVKEHYLLDTRGLTVTCEVRHREKTIPFRYALPVLVDGGHNGEPNGGQGGADIGGLGTGTLELAYLGSRVRISGPFPWEKELGEPAANRMGFYRCAHMGSDGVPLTLSFQSAGKLSAAH